MPGVIATIPKLSFSNAIGTPLVGGTLTTYLAGTTTLATTYQDQAMETANANPIPLDARGECVVWLDSARQYKFVLKDLAGGVIWTQDNISGALRNRERPVEVEKQIAQAGQSVFTLQGISYTPGINSLHVYLDGFRLSMPDYAETSATVVTFAKALRDGQEVLFEAGSGVNSLSATDATMIPYSPAAGDATNVKMALDALQTASLDKSGELPTPQKYMNASQKMDVFLRLGALDVTAAVQQAIDNHMEVYVPPGVYLISGAGLFHRDGMTLRGAGRKASILKKKAGTDQLDPILRERFVNSLATPAYNVTVEHLGFEGNGDPALPGAKGAGLLRFYEHYGLRVVACDFYNSRGYGAGFEGAQSSPTATRRGPHVDSYFEDCNFYSNGKKAYLVGTDTDDGVDFKGSDRAVFVGCRAWDNGDKGFDCRARNLSMSGCYSWGNAGSGFACSIEGVQAGVTSINPASGVYLGCYSWGNAGAGFSIVPQVTPGVVGGLQFVTFQGCYADDNTHNFSIASQGSNDLAILRLMMNGCTSRNPKVGSRHLLGSAPAESVSVTGGSYTGGSTVGLSVNVAQTGPFNVSGATIDGTGSNAIAGSGDAAARMNVSGNVFRNITGYAVLGTSNCTISGNTYEAVSQAAIVSLSGTNNRMLDKAVGTRTVASAATLTLPEITDSFTITGTTNITSITASWAQRLCVLRFTGVLTVTDGGNLALSGDFVTANNAVLVLFFDGLNWQEITRRMS